MNSRMKTAHLSFNQGVQFSNALEIQFSVRAVREKQSELGQKTGG